MFDFFPDIGGADDPRRMGLLAAAAALMQGNPRGGRGLMGDVGYGLLSGLSGYSQAKEAQMKQAQDAQQRELMGYQLQQARQGVADESTYRDAMKNAPVFSAPTAPNMAPTPANAAQLKTPSLYEQAMKNIEYLRSKGVNEKYVKPYVEQIEKLRPKYKADQQLINMPDGSLGMVNIADDGSMSVVPFKPAEKQKDVNLGGQVAMVGEYSGAPRQTFGKTMGPEDIARNAVDWARLNQAERHFQLGNNQYDPDRGIVVNTRLGVAAPVTMGGANLPPRMSEHVKNQLAGLDSEAKIVEGAIKSVEANPSAYTMNRGLATMASPITESIAGRMDSPAERQSRAYLFNVVSKVINERAGAAQSDQELARLRSFLPAETDIAEQIRDKLMAYQDYLREKRAGLASGGNRPPLSSFMTR